MSEQQTKLNVEFKPVKKMKKRRQLDALVGNGKLRKSRSGHELLPDGSESESSEIDEFNVSDQKSLLRKSRQSSTCSTCSSVFAVFIIGACVLSCCGLFWMHFKLKQSLDEIKEKIYEVQAKNGDDVGNVQSLESDVNDLKKRVEQYKTGSNGLDHLNATLYEMSKKIAALNSSMSSLHDSLNLKSASEIKQLSTQLPVISNTVASLGVDVKSLGKKVEDLVKFKESAEQHISSMSDQGGEGGRETNRLATPAPQSMNPEIANEIAKKFQKLTDSLTNTNNSMWTEMGRLQVVLDGHKAKFGTLDSTIATLQKSVDAMSDHTGPDREHSVVNSDSLTEEGVKVIVHQMIEEMGLANATSDTHDTRFDQLLVNMDNITGMVQALKVQLGEMKSSPSEGGISKKTDFMLAHNDLTSQVQSMNESMSHLRSDLMTLMKKVSQQQNQLVNVSHTVKVMQAFVEVLEKEHGDFRNNIGNMSGVDSESTANIPETTGSLTTMGTQTSTAVPARNMPPLATTAGKLTLHLPLSEIVLDATNSTDDKEIVKYRWEQMRGPSHLKIADVEKANTTATGEIKEGTYEFSVQVWDKEHLSSSMVLFVHVEPPEAGSDLSTKMPSDQADDKAGGLHKYITMSLVKNMDDLELGIRRWDRNGDGYVNAEDLPDYMPDPPAPEELKKFDFDHNGKYSKDEFAVALGFKPWPEDNTEGNDIP